MIVYYKPTRIVTSTVIVKNGSEEGVHVKTERDIPLGNIFKVALPLFYFVTKM